MASYRRRVCALGLAASVALPACVLSVDAPEAEPAVDGSAPLDGRSLTEEPDAASESDALAGAVDAAPPDADLSCFGETAIPLQLGVPYQGNNADGPTNDQSCDRTEGPEAYHRIVLEEQDLPADLVVTTDLAGTTYDTVIRIWTACDLAAGTELDCHDGGTGETSTLPISNPGVYYVVVDSHAGGGGDYEVKATLQ